MFAEQSNNRDKIKEATEVMGVNVKKLTTLSLSVALSMILSFVESQIPAFVAVPGVKIGLSNIVTVFLLYKFGWREAGAVSLVRVFLSSMLFGSVDSLAYSLSGAVFSFIIMLITKRISLFSELGVSVSGGIFHNVAQILMAMLIMENEKIAMYLPALLISGTIAGAVVGIVAALLVKKLGKII